MKTVEQFKFHQALHGYEKGHQQLAISCKLDSKDQRVLLSLSDISGSGIKLESSGYLTGYPLQASGCYALSKTWPAPEMARPGCVWTHTLLIDFSDLAIMDSLTPLLDLFKKPSRGSKGFYQDPIATNSSFKFDKELPYMQDLWPQKVLVSLYKNPDKTVLATRLEAKTEERVVQIWSQQWPKLRRNFVFCTFSISDRKLNGKSFDLQITPDDNKVSLSSFLNSVDSASNEVQKEPWAGVASEDLINPDKAGLRTFFRKAASDVDIGRDGFILLSTAFLALKNERIYDLVKLFKNQLKNQSATHTRVLSTTLIAKKIDSIDSDAFEFFWNNIHLLPTEVLNDNCSKVGLEIWKRDSSKLLSLLNREKIELSRFSQKVLMIVPLGELSAAISKIPDIQQSIINLRPEILYSEKFWEHLDLNAWSISIPDNTSSEKAILAAFNSKKSDVTESLVGVFGLEYVLRTWNKLALNNKSPEVNLGFIKDNHLGGVSNFLSLEIDFSFLILKKISRIISPDSVPTINNTDPWLNAFTRIHGNQFRNDIYLSAYAFSRALGPTTCCSGQLAAFSFETLHTAAYSSRIDRESWDLVESKLISSIFSWDWDRCKRLRDTTANLFVKRDIPPSIFFKITSNEYLFKQLLKSMHRVNFGDRYIRSLIDTIKDNPDLSTVSVEQVIKTFNF